MSFIAYDDFGGLIAALTDAITTALARDIAQRGRASLALPGGDTPGPLYDALAARPLDWSAVTVMLTDERWVAEDHPRSNTAFLKSRLLTGAARDADFLPFYNELGMDVKVISSLSDQVSHHLPLSVLVLGMGEDMHCASLFPGASELPSAAAPDAPSLSAMTPQDGLEPRITLTVPALRSAGQTHILIKGDGKRAAWQRAAQTDPTQAPVAHFIPHATTHWTA